MMSCTFKFRTRYHVLIDINSSARIHDNCTVWEHDSAWNHVGILGFLLQNFFKEEDATKLSIVHGGDVCTLHGLNSCQCIFRRSYPILIQVWGLCCGREIDANIRALDIEVITQLHK
ncbi:hypothetical protein CXB51_018822 [Gossypium anomalum]|uniref:Uncharacterized protein n=1 Tax=Gossypium anomalum TaxID=47600 RepID=A0A8J6CUC8_9ROSI|nr:hypothetical protein CXB51_018822 [Gossypium anomalum]